MFRINRDIVDAIIGVMLFNANDKEFDLKHK